MDSRSFVDDDEKRRCEDVAEGSEDETEKEADNQTDQGGLRPLPRLVIHQLPQPSPLVDRAKGVDEEERPREDVEGDEGHGTRGNLSFEGFLENVEDKGDEVAKSHAQPRTYPPYFWTAVVLHQLPHPSPKPN